MLVEDYADTAANQTWTTTDYLYDGLELISETITKTVGANPTTVWQVFYFYDAAGRPWAAVDRKLSTSAGSTHSFYLITDDRGDVLELLEADHIAFGSYRYDVYGRPTETTARTTSTTAMDSSWMAPITENRSLLRYAGYSYDAHSELYYLQRRYYDAVTRQFLSRDPWKSDGPESPYQYCAGNPVAGVDPWGLYVTASGGRTNTWFRFPAGNVYGGNGNGDWYSRAPTGTGHRGAGRSSDTKPLARWRGSVGGGGMPGLAGAAARGTYDFFYTGAELFAWGTGCPWAHPFEDTGFESEIDMVSMYLPLPGGKVRVGGMALRETMLVVRVGSTAERAGRAAGVAWKVGDATDALTRAGRAPSRSTVRARFWKNTAASGQGAWDDKALARMRQGKPPQRNGISMEIHHKDPLRNGGSDAMSNLQPLWPWEHAAIDEYRYYNGWTPPGWSP